MSSQCIVQIRFQSLIYKLLINYVNGTQHSHVGSVASAESLPFQVFLTYTFCFPEVAFVVISADPFGV